MLSWVWRAPSSYLFLLGIIGPSLKGFMLAIDIASTYGPMDFFDVHWINDPWWNLQQCLPACDNWSLLCWSSWESLVFIIKTYLYDTYHHCDIILVTLGSILNHISMEKRSCFHGQGGFSHPCRRGWTTWTLKEKIGKFTLILSRPFHFAILLWPFLKHFLVKQTDLFDCLQIILFHFHLDCRFEGKLLILGLFFG